MKPHHEILETLRIKHVQRLGSAFSSLAPCGMLQKEKNENRQILKTSKQKGEIKGDNIPLGVLISFYETELKVIITCDLQHN